MKTCLLICLCCLASTSLLRADTSGGSTYCDTLVTFDGQVIPAEIVENNYDEIRYYNCGDTSRTLNFIPKNLVWNIKRAYRAPQEAPVVPPEVQAQRSERLGKIVLGFSFAGLLMLVFGLTSSVANLLLLGSLILVVCLLLGIYLLGSAPRAVLRFKQARALARGILLVTIVPLGALLIRSVVEMVSTGVALWQLFHG